jgi:hypothetical protein
MTRNTAIETRYVRRFAIAVTYIEVAESHKKLAVRAGVSFPVK